jgi:hypothetical protein
MKVLVMLKMQFIIWMVTSLMDNELLLKLLVEEEDPDPQEVEVQEILEELLESATIVARKDIGQEIALKVIGKIVATDVAKEDILRETVPIVLVSLIAEEEVQFLRLKEEEEDLLLQKHVPELHLAADLLLLQDLHVDPDPELLKTTRDPDLELQLITSDLHRILQPLPSLLKFTKRMEMELNTPQLTKVTFHSLEILKSDLVISRFFDTFWLSFFSCFC